MRFTGDRIRANCFTGNRTGANCETPENEEESKTRQGLELRHLRTSKQCHSKENHGNCLRGTSYRLDCSDTGMLMLCASNVSTGHLSQKHWAAASLSGAMTPNIKLQTALWTGYGTTVVRLWTTMPAVQVLHPVGSLKKHQPARNV